MGEKAVWQASLKERMVPSPLNLRRVRLHRRVMRLHRRVMRQHREPAAELGFGTGSTGGHSWGVEASYCVFPSFSEVLKPLWARRMPSTRVARSSARV